VACEAPASTPDAAAPADGGAVDDAAWDDGGADAAEPSDAGLAADAGALDGGQARRSLLVGGHELLFVGNSYVFVNDLPARYRLGADALGPAPVRVESVAFGGYRLAQHAADARTDGTPLAGWLRTGSAAQRSFDVVVLQEQSQIGGFPESEPARVASLDAVSELAVRARENASAVVLYLTWGRERGDDTNPALYPTFSAMQDRLDAGYLAMAARLRDEGTVTRVAPVGAAFRVVHDDLVASGAEPTAEGSDFDALYDADGSHPSARGAYLASLVFLATITGEDARALPDAPDLEAEVCTRLREAAQRVMDDPRWGDALR
jgi:hypothetical protein